MAHWTCQEIVNQWIIESLRPTVESATTQMALVINWLYNVTYSEEPIDLVKSIAAGLESTKKAKMISKMAMGNFNLEILRAFARTDRGFLCFKCARAW